MMTKDDEILQRAWEQLTILTLRKGFGHLWMHHFVATEFDRLCADPIMRERIGVEPLNPHGQGEPTA
jgi:hypothetical protein